MAVSHIDVEEQPLLELGSIQEKVDDVKETGEAPTSLPLPSRRSSASMQPPGSSFRRLLLALVPTFLKPGTRTIRKNGIAALDGFRGLACLAVFNEHFVILYQTRMSQHWINRLPLIRLWRYGHGAVFLFFVISGYVLTCKPLKQVRAHDFDGFQKTISSSILRRGFRLYLPCLAVSSLLLLLTVVGYFDWPYHIYDKFYYITFIEEAPPLVDTSLEYLLKIYWENVHFIFCGTFPFEIKLGELEYYLYDKHQWTIPIEFRGSIAIFAALVGTSRLRGSWRLCAHCVLFWYLYRTLRTYVSLFFAGMICAEFDLMRQDFQISCARRGPYSKMSQLHRVARWALDISEQTAKILYILTFIVGCYVMSSPNEYLTAGNWLPHVLSGSQGYYDLRAWDNTLLTVGSIMVVWAVANCSSLGILFNNAFVQYLGNISYALYLVHGTVIRSLGYVWMPMALRIATMTPMTVELTGEWFQSEVSNAQCVVAWCLGFTVTGSIAFWWADLFWTYIDTPVVKFARWLEAKMTAPHEQTA